MNDRGILVVDDEEGIRETVSRMLSYKGFETETANGPAEALAAAERFEPALVLTDIRMPGMDGVELARQLKRVRPDTPVIMMTAFATVDTAIESLKLGVDDYIRKPIDWDQAITSIRMALDKRTKTQNNKKYVEDLEQKLLHAQKKPAATLLGAVKGLFTAEGPARSAMLDMVESYATAMGARDPVTKDHSRRVGAYMAKMAEFLSFPPEEVRQFRLAGLLHDIGKIGIPDEILQKNEEDMTKEELARYKEHPITSHRILQPVREFQPILDMVLHHHEQFDGCGYPYGLSGTHIPIGARMMAVADTYSHVGLEDAHDESLHEACALGELIAERGRRFDPEMVDTFIRIMHQVRI